MGLQGIRAYRTVVTGIVLPITLAGCFMNDPVEPAQASAPPPDTVGNNAPVISGNAPRVVKVGVAYDFRPQASDPDGDHLVFRIDNKPMWATFDPDNGRVTGVPQLGHEGSYNDVEISASDGWLSTTLPGFTVSVEPNTAPNMPPEIDGTPPTSVVVGNAYSFTPAGSDPDGNALTYSIQNMPVWATFNSQSGRLAGTPRPGHERTYSNIAITVSDSVSTASLPAFSITVIEPNATPTINGTPPSSVIAGTAYSFVPTASDPNNDPLTFGVDNLPAWATFNTTTGELSGTPQASDIRNHGGIVIGVSDGRLSASLPAFSINVTAVNSSPQISGSPSPSVTVGQGYSFEPTAFDADGDRLTFRIRNRPWWATFNSRTGELSARFLRFPVRKNK